MVGAGGHPRRDDATRADVVDRRAKRSRWGVGLGIGSIRLVAPRSFRAASCVVGDTKRMLPHQEQFPVPGDRFGNKSLHG